MDGHGRKADQPLCRCRTRRPILSSMQENASTGHQALGFTEDPQARRTAAWVALAALVLLVAVSLALYKTSRPAVFPGSVQTAPPPVVAVLPLIDLDGARYSTFNEALTAEISAGLAMVPGLEVRGRSSARGYTDVNRDAGQAGADLGVAVVLDATSRRSGGRLHVTTRLIDTRSGAVLWSDMQDTTLEEWFRARDAIVEGTAAAMGLNLADATRRRLARRRANIDAFDLYGQGRFGWAEGEDGDLLEAVSFYHMAIAADSGFAPAWTALAGAYAMLPRFTRFSVERTRQDGAAAARTALRIDPGEADAHAVLGEILYLYERDFSGGRLHLERAVALDPGNADAHARLCELAMYEDRIPDARDACRRAAEADPLSFHGAWLRANLQKLQGEFDMALADLNSLRTAFPGYAPLSADLMFTRLLVGDSVRGGDELRYWVGLLGGSEELATELFGGNRSAALGRLAAEVDPAPSDLATLGALLGEYPAALEAAATAVRLRDPGSLKFAVFPEYAALRTREDFKLLLEELKLTSARSP